MATNMQQPQRQAVPAFVNGHSNSQTPTANGQYGQAQRPRTLTVEEALQFSPLTTSPATGLDRIPLPEIGITRVKSNLTTKGDRAEIFKDLEDLKSYRRSDGPQEYMRVVREVQQYLKADDLPEFKLKPRFRSALPKSAPSSPSVNAASQLSPFAKMVLDSTNIPYRYPTPSTPSPKVKPTTGTNSTKVPNLQLSQQHGPKHQNLSAYNANAKVKVGAKAVSQKSATSIVVQPLSPTERAQYTPLPDSPKRRKLDSQQATENRETRVEPVQVDIPVAPIQKDAALAVEKLLELLQEIFEAEDQYQPDTSMVMNKQGNIFFDASVTNEDGLPRLSVKSHSKIQSAVKAVVGFDQLQSVPLDYLRRLQRLCEEPILSLDSLDLEPKDDTDEDRLLTWQHHLRVAENCMASASTFMCIVLGNLREKELFPVEISSKLPEYLHKVIENVVIAVVELRSTGKTASHFTAAKSSREVLSRLVLQSRRFLDYFADLHMKMKDTDLAINALVALGPRLICTENTTTEKDSVLGFQTFESLRKVAMNVLAKVFARYQDQQHSIVEGILDFLSKLPTSKQVARQFRLNQGKAIQSISALFMQLVQAAASTVLQEDGDPKTRPPRQSALDSDDDQDENIDNRESLELSPVEGLRTSTKPLIGFANLNARRIMQGFLKRAVISKKNGDDKHRTLLDLFIEDLINVVGSSEWPGAEILLRSLTSDLFYSITGKLMIDGEECGIPANTVLEMLGWMASAILSLKDSLAKSMTDQETDEDDDNKNLTHAMQRLADDQLLAGLRPEDLITFDGPFRAVIESLEDMGSNNWHLSNAKKLYILQWADMICTILEKDSVPEGNLGDVTEQVRQMIQDPRYLESNRLFRNITATPSRLANQLIVLNSGFCKYFNHIIKVIVSSINSDQVKTRSRSLKSIVSLLEVDPKLLDKEPGIMRAIFRCTTDSSPMVRDSALSLIGTYISITPKLLDEGCVAIFRCSNDPSVGVRKKCISLFKDIYRLEQRHDLKIAISDMVLQRIQDPEDSVSNLARQTLEDLWFADLTQTVTGTDVDERARTKVAISHQTEIIVRTIQRNEQNRVLLENFLRTLLGEKSKTNALLEKCCKAIVSDAFDKAVTLQSESSSRNAEFLLQTLTILANARPRLIDSGRLETLLPYLTNLKPKKEDGDSSDELSLFQSVVAIFHSVTPHLSAMEKPLLGEVQRKLFESIGKLPKSVLDEVTACLWTIHGVLQETTRFTRFAFSVLKNGLEMRGRDLNDGTTMLKLRSYLRILGSVGKNWDLESQFAFFKKAQPTTTETSVAGLFVEFIVPFTTPGQTLALRAISLDSLGSICQLWPGQFNKSHVQRSLSYVFSEDNSDLQDIVLRVFAGFFGIRENAVEAFAVKSNDDTQDQELGRLGGSLKASEHDGAAAIIGSHFLQPMLKVATSRLDHSALTAVRVIASINRQGLVHPKECAGALVALGTSTNQAISKVAIETHRLLHQQHETMFEREYMRAVQETFAYQRDIIGDVLGASARPYVPKLRALFDIVKISNAKYVKKFLSGLIVKSTFDLTKLDASGNPPDAVLFAQFIMHNVAFFEYARVEDLLHTIGHMESVIGKLGIDVAQMIETKILRTALSLLPGEPVVENGTTLVEAPNQFQPPAITQAPVDMMLLRQLTTAAMIISIIHETKSYLKKQYSVAKVHLSNGNKKDSKELSKAPTRAHGVNGDRYWDAVKGITISMASEDSMKARCQEFVTLMSVDDEVKVGGDDSDEGFSGSEDVDLDDSMMNTPSGRKGSKGKRKNSVSIGGTPKKRKGKIRVSGGLPSDESDDGWE